MLERTSQRERMGSPVEEKLTALKRYFGYDAFRPGQEAVVDLSLIHI